jgi:AcrR family transcriptional regulator
VALVDRTQKPSDDVPSLADTTSLKELPSTNRGLRTRATLVAAARKVFERDGFLNARLTDIPKEANCSVGTFYTYFADKEEILQAVLEAAQNDMLHPGQPRLDPGDSSPIAVIEASNRAYFEAYKRNAKLMLILEQVDASDPKFRQVRNRRSDAFAQRNGQAIKDLQDRGLADPALDPYLAARTLSGMVSRLAYQVFCLNSDIPFEDLVFISTRLWANALRITE